MGGGYHRSMQRRKGEKEKGRKGKRGMGRFND
jgi:hypothetical protein